MGEVKACYIVIYSYLSINETIIENYVRPRLEERLPSRENTVVVITVESAVCRASEFYQVLSEHQRAESEF